MSDEQAGVESEQLAQPESPAGNRWGDPISAERQAELKALDGRQRNWAIETEDGQQRSWTVRADAPREGSAFKGMKLTGADVFWLTNWADTEAAATQLDVWRDPNVGTVLLQDANLEEAQLQDADLRGAKLRGVRLWGADLRGTMLKGADLRDANLQWAQLQGANMENVSLQGANLTGVRMNIETTFRDVGLNTRTLMADVVWNGVALVQVDWRQAPRLGDEFVARLPRDVNGGRKDAADYKRDFKAAVRANRVLAVTLRGQGMNEDADRFAYRAQVLQRQVLWREWHLLQALFSVFLDRLAGHGYKPGRTLGIYLLAILSFGIAYYFLGQSVGPHLSPLGAFVLSMTSFHGRGFFPGNIAVDDPLTVLAAFEALVGLVIEASFIATFTQRFFAR